MPVRSFRITSAGVLVHFSSNCRLSEWLFMGHSRRLLNSHQVVRLSDVTVGVANADREYGANLLYRFNVSDRIRGCVRAAEPQATERQRIGDEIISAMIFARANLVNVFNAYHLLALWHRQYRARSSGKRSLPS